MLNYYEILGIPKNADFQVIKSAFKKLALTYHPDRNPGNKAAEEFFKQVNHAYQILSNPEKRKRYDFLLNYNFQHPQNTVKADYRPYKATKGKSVYNRYGKYDWKNTPRYKKAPFYKIDKNYARLQAVTILCMILLGSLVMGVNKYWSYLNHKKSIEIQAGNRLKLEKAHSLYQTGKFRAAIDLVIQLDRENPFESQYYEEKGRMLSNLFQSANEKYNQRAFKDAATRLEIVRDYEHPMRMKTFDMLAEAYYELNDYKNAALTLSKMLERDKFNLRLCVRIARIYNLHLDNPTKALDYYNEAKLLFKQFQNSTYGDAFELVVQPDRLPDFYHELFIERAKLNMISNNYKVALTDCNWAIFLRPHISSTYNMRAHCKRLTGQLARACLDWQRAIERGHQKSFADLNKYCQ